MYIGICVRENRQEQYVYRLLIHVYTHKQTYVPRIQKEKKENFDSLIQYYTAHNVIPVYIIIHKMYNRRGNADRCLIIGPVRKTKGQFLHHRYISNTYYEEE